MVIFSVKFFSSLYEVVSIQASSSLLTTAFIIACDLVFTARSLWRLYDTTRSLQLLLQITKADVLLPALADLCEAPERCRSSSVVDHDKQRTAIIEATAMLFRTEILMLIEYLECMMPLFYALNMVIMWLSPNAHYYLLTASIKTLDQLLLVIINISVLFAAEVASFVLLNWILRKRLRFSPMHQVAFAMENHVSTIRASMLFVLVLVLHMNVVHTGVDFSFRFKWLHSNYSNSTSTNA